MNIEEFLQPREAEPAETPALREEDNVNEAVEQEGETDTQVEIDVQKAVVESLAADKAIQDEKIVALENKNAELIKQVADLQAKIESLQAKINEQSKALTQVGEILAKNSETTTSNQISLLDRDVEVPDRFPGETRDQVLDAIKEARDKAEADGRIRRAQVLESVLVANEPTGNLAKKKAALEKFFNENQNILSGPVIEELQKYGISHKNGEEYLLPAEIIKRTY